MTLTTWIILFERATRLIEWIICGAVECTTARRHDGCSNICKRKMNMNRGYMVWAHWCWAHRLKVHMRIDRIDVAQLQFARIVFFLLWKCVRWMTKTKQPTFHYCSWFCISNYVNVVSVAGLAFTFTTNEKKKNDEKSSKTARRQHYFNALNPHK